ncbi:MAG: hypothetical protein LBS17_01350 [Actinomycetes bacterium]|jgi:hypothetical protein|nr:hypothetical protein [Actinomycetes bacterium]
MVDTFRDTVEPSVRQRLEDSLTTREQVENISTELPSAGGAGSGADAGRTPPPAGPPRKKRNGFWETIKSLLLTLLLVVLVVGGSFVLTLYAREKGWIQGKEVIEEPDADVADEDVADDGTGEDADWAAEGGEAEYPYIVRVQGAAVTAKKITFEYNGKSYTIQPTVESDVYHGAVAAARGYTIPADAADDEYAQEDLLIAYYNKLAYDPEMETSINSVLTQLAAIKQSAKLDADEYCELLAKYVQSIPYDTARNAAEVKGSVAGDPRMPIQVLVDGTGDCDEKTMLLATLLTHSGYEVSGELWQTEKHMALAVAVEDSDKALELSWGESGYAFIETTQPIYVSEIPTSFVGDKQLTSTPVDIPFGDGESDVYYSASAMEQVARIVAARNAAYDAANSEKAVMDAATGDSAYNKAVKRYNKAITAINTLQVTVDENGKKYDDFKDRVAAIKWLDKNQWW